MVGAAWSDVCARGRIRVCVEGHVGLTFTTPPPRPSPPPTSPSCFLSPSPPIFCHLLPLFSVPFSPFFHLLPLFPAKFFTCFLHLLPCFLPPSPPFFTFSYCFLPYSSPVFFTFSPVFWPPLPLFSVTLNGTAAPLCPHTISFLHCVSVSVAASHVPSLPLFPSRRPPTRRPPARRTPALPSSLARSLPPSSLPPCFPRTSLRLVP